MSSHPISTTYLDRQIARVSAVLELASAWDPAPLELLCAGFTSLILAFTYTRTGAGGGFDWQMQTSLYSPGAAVPAGAAVWTPESLLNAGTIVPGTEVQSDVQGAYQEYIAVGAAQEGFTFGPIRLAAGVERVRIPAREIGTPVAPGTLQIQASFTVD